jgi:hypothetical protein
MITFDYKPSYRKGKLICDENTLSMIRRHFSCQIENIAFIRRQSGNDRIPDREYAIQKTGMFDFGIYEEIENFLISEQITEIEYTDSFKERLNCGYAIEELFDELNYENRDYGRETLQNAFKTGYGTIVIGTGGGKSFITASLIENIYRNTKDTKFKCLIVVPGLSLVNQLVENFEEYGVNFTYSGWTGKTPLQDTNVVICNSENFCAQFPSHNWIQNVDLVIADECFHGDTLVKTMRGDIPIKDVVIGDLALTMHNNTKEWKPVINTWKNIKKSDSDHFISILLESGKTINVTPDHIFYTKTGKKKASELSIMDDLIDLY